MLVFTAFALFGAPASFAQSGGVDSSPVADPTRDAPAGTSSRTAADEERAPSALPGAPWSEEVAVVGGDAAERREAQQIALREVLLANSGDKTLLNRDDVRAALDDAERYVERFDYRVPPPGTVLARGTSLTDAVRRTGEATRLLLIRFDPGLLGALIEREPPPDTAADDEAPETIDPFEKVETALVWLLIEDDRRDIMISDPAARIVRARAREIAGARGVTLVYPSDDEEARDAVDVEDVREGRIERLRAASERYRASFRETPVVLVGRLGRDGLDSWEGSWTRFAGGAPPGGAASDEVSPAAEAESASFTTGSLDEALQAGFGWLSAATADDDGYRYGGEGGSSTEALVWFGPLDSVSAYASVMSFLEAVPGVGTVYPKEADERGTAFTVVPRTALPAIASAAASRDWLRRTSPPSYPVSTARGGRQGSGGGVEDRAGEDPRFATSDERGDELPNARTSSGRFPDERVPDGRLPEGSSPSARSSERAAPEYRPLAPNAELAFEYLR